MKYHIVSIGISNYPDPFSDLRFASKDAQNFFNLFTTNVADLGYSKLLLGSEATLGRIRSALGEELRESLQPQDALIFFFSGHGSTALVDGVLAHFLIPFDGTRDIASSALSVIDLKEALDAIQCTGVFAFVDACFSGAVAAKGFTNPRVKSGAPLKSFQDTVSGEGRFTFAACRDDEKAYEDDENENGLFTHALIQHLLAPKESPTFPVESIFHPVTQRVIERAKLLRVKQTPSWMGSAKGSVLLPAFKRARQVTPDLSPFSGSSPVVTPGPAPDFNIPEEGLREFIQAFPSGDDPSLSESRKKIRVIEFDNYCAALIQQLYQDWEKIVDANNDPSIADRWPEVIAEIESAAHGAFLLCGSAIVFGSPEYVRILARNFGKIGHFGENKAGIIALTKTPQLIIALALELMGMVAIAHARFDNLKAFLETRIITRHRERGASTVYELFPAFYGHTLGGKGTVAHDHYRDVLNKFSWLEELTPAVHGQVDYYELQANLLFCLYAAHKELQFKVWPDFSRFYADKVMEFVNRIVYDATYQAALAPLFDCKASEVREKLRGYMEVIVEKKRGEGYWDSVTQFDFLTREEQLAEERKKQEKPDLPHV